MPFVQSRRSRFLWLLLVSAAGCNSDPLSPEQGDSPTDGTTQVAPQPDLAADVDAGALTDSFLATDIDFVADANFAADAPSTADAPSIADGPPLIDLGSSPSDAPRLVDAFPPAGDVAMVVDAGARQDAQSIADLRRAARDLPLADLWAPIDALVPADLLASSDDLVVPDFAVSPEPGDLGTTDPQSPNPDPSISLIPDLASSSGPFPAADLQSPKSPSDGCSGDLDGDPNNCGRCGLACTVAHGTPRCAGGRCAVASCDAGWADCDGDDADGCETDIASRVDSCGACNDVCDVQHAQPRCVAGQCAIEHCQSPFQDCNNTPLDGCETDSSADPGNCGGCGQECGRGQLCQDGACSGASACTDAECTATLGNATGQCVGGKCVIASCNPGYVNCLDLPNACDNLLATDCKNCGQCGAICSSTNIDAPSCEGGMCVGICAAGYLDCNGDKRSDGCEIDSGSDDDNCGACGVVCPIGSACSRGACSSVTGACAGGCDLPHATAQCQSDKCAVVSCDSGYADCNALPVDGCEVHTVDDASHCGACDNVCPLQNGHAVCSMSACGIDACAAPFTNCSGDGDGCPVDLSSDYNNCGTCGTVCADGMTCQSGSCVSAGSGCPGGCDLANATSQCLSGRCTILRCDSGFGDCDLTSTDGCETTLSSDPRNCGGCAITCTAPKVCDDGTCR